MAWTSRGALADGYLFQPSSLGHTISTPALSTHHGALFCLWLTPDNTLAYAIGNNSLFGAPIPFPDAGVPIMADVLGLLHAIIVRALGEMMHYIFDDVRQEWVLEGQLGWKSTGGMTPALSPFHNKLFLTYIRGRELYYSIWERAYPQDDPAQHDEQTETPAQAKMGIWKAPQEISGLNTVRGIPALFALDGRMHVLCGSDDKSKEREILGFVYDPASDVWNSSHDVSEGKAATGVSATSYGESAYLAFQENGPGDQSHLMFIAEFANGTWRPQDAVAGQTSADPPQLAVLNGRLNCVFNSNDNNRALRWYSRPLLDFELDGWMGEISDSTLLCDMTVPGTHDSCAMSNIPFVRTQYLSVAKQMEAGLRFLDLRCRVHADGMLYMYHGGIPINMPFYLSFDAVMDEVFNFMTKTDSGGTKKPTETVFVSINNDDTSGHVPVSTFYDAVAAHIAKAPRYPDGSDRWATNCRSITLGQARGKAVLLRRYQVSPDLPVTQRIGLELSGWVNDNPSFKLQTPDGITVNIQDKWQYSEILPLTDLISSKCGFVHGMLQQATETKRAAQEEGREEESWFLNFTSAVGDPLAKGEIAESHWIAVGRHSNLIGSFIKGMNTTLRSFDWQSGSRYGIIPMDYPESPKESDLIARIIGVNM